MTLPCACPAVIACTSAATRRYVTKRRGGPGTMPALKQRGILTQRTQRTRREPSANRCSVPAGEVLNAPDCLARSPGPIPQRPAPHVEVGAFAHEIDPSSHGPARKIEATWSEIQRAFEFRFAIQSTLDLTQKLVSNSWRIRPRSRFPGSGGAQCVTLLRHVTRRYAIAACSAAPLVQRRWSGSDELATHRERAKVASTSSSDGDITLPLFCCVLVMARQLQHLQRHPQAPVQLL